MKYFYAADNHQLLAEKKCGVALQVKGLPDCHIDAME